MIIHSCLHHVHLDMKMTSFLALGKGWKNCRPRIYLSLSLSLYYIYIVCLLLYIHIYIYLLRHVYPVVDTNFRKEILVVYTSIDHRSPCRATRISRINRVKHETLSAQSLHLPHNTLVTREKKLERYRQNCFIIVFVDWKVFQFKLSNFFRYYYFEDLVDFD